MDKTRIQKSQSSQRSTRTANSSEFGPNRYQFSQREPMNVSSSDEETNTEKTTEDIKKGKSRLDEESKDGIEGEEYNDDNGRDKSEDEENKDINDKNNKELNNEEENNDDSEQEEQDGSGEEEGDEGVKKPTAVGEESTSEETSVEEEGAETNIKKEKRNHHVSKRLSLQVDWRNFCGYKCYFEDLISNVIEIASKFDKRTTEILMQTPFGQFFNMIIKMTITKGMVEKCSYSIIDIIGMYTGEGNAFMFKENGEVVRLEAEEISLMFGIPIRGETFDTRDKGKQTVGEFEKKYFKKAKRVTKKELLIEIQTILDKKIKTDQDRIDIVKMLLLYSFATFFFATTNGSVTKTFLKKFESLAYVNNCSWPRMIHTFLMKSIRTHYKKPISVSGCVYVLLYFLAEHTNILTPIKRDKNLSPRVLKWNLSKLTGDNWPDAFARLGKTKVLVGLEELTNNEKLLLNMDGQMVEEEFNEDINDNAQDDTVGLADDNFRHLYYLCDAVEQYSVDMLEDGGDEIHQINQNEGSIVERQQKREENMTEERRPKTNNQRSTTIGGRRKYAKSIFSKDKKRLKISDVEFCGVDENIEVDLENLPDDTVQLKYLLKREHGLRERLHFKVRHFEESGEHKKKLNELDDERERFKAQVSMLNDYWEEAHKIYYQDNARKEKSFAEYVDAYERECSSNKRVREELEKKIKDLNDVYALQSKLVQKLNKELADAVKKEQKLLRILGEATTKLFAREVEDEMIEKEKNVSMLKEAQDNKKTTEGVERCTLTDENIEGLIVEVQCFKTKLTDKEVDLKVAEEKVVQLKNQFEELAQQNEVLDSELRSEKERSKLMNEENEMLKSTLENAKEELRERVNVVKMLENTLDQYKMLRLVPCTSYSTSIANEEEVKTLKAENMRLVQELHKVQQIITENNQLRSERQVLSVHLRGINKMLEEQNKKQPEDQSKVMFAFPLSVVHPPGEPRQQEKELNIVLSEKPNDEKQNRNSI